MNRAIGLYVALHLFACVDPGNQPTLADTCGPTPGAPGWGVQASGDTITMTRADYLAILQWHTDVTTWSACVETFVADRSRP